MAQFSYADFGGMSQWSPGMSMVGDMFNTQIKSKLDALCTDIAAHLEQSEPAGGGGRAASDGASYRSMFGSTDWWPSELGRPGAVGAQNELRYVVCAKRSRCHLDLRYRQSSNIRRRSSSEQRPNPFIHQSRRSGKSGGPSKDRRMKSFSRSTSKVGSRSVGRFLRLLSSEPKCAFSSVPATWSCPKCNRRLVVQVKRSPLQFCELPS
jgi:hypothetical protein